MKTLTPYQLERLNQLNFIAGVGHPTEPQHTACVMSAAALLVAIENNDEAGYTETDYLPCVCPTIRRLGIIINDSYKNNAERKEWAITTIPRILGTNISRELTQKRAYLCADYAVRKFAVAALQAKGKPEEAAKLAALAPITDQATCKIAKEAADSADSADAAYAASSAASAADAYAAYAADAAYAAAYAAYAADAADASKIIMVQELLDACLAITE